MRLIELQKIDLQLLAQVNFVIIFGQLAGDEMNRDDSKFSPENNFQG